MSDLELFLDINNINYESNVKLGNITYGKVGGYCECIIYPNSIDKIKKSILFLKENSLEYTVIGETSNLLFLDDVRYGVILSTKLLSDINFNDNNSEVVVGAGVNLGFFLRKLFSLNIGGFEGLEGIPGSVGGAVFMNAGAYGFDISKYITLVECVDKNSQIIRYDFDSCKFKQRSSIFRDNREVIILSVIFRLEKTKDLNIYSKIENYHTARHCYQEFVYPNMGSIFTAKKCIYEEFSNVDKRYRIIKTLINRIFYNRFTRIFSGRKQNRKVINKFTINYFGLNEHSSVISDKHINMFANRGGSSWDLIDYIIKVKSILGDKVSLENEIVTSNIKEVYTNKFEKYVRKIEKAKKYEW